MHGTIRKVSEEIKLNSVFPFERCVGERLDPVNSNRSAAPMMFFPWYPAVMLAFESNNVIDIRMRKVATSTPIDAFREVSLMVTEKVAASMHTATLLMFGGSAADVVEHYRSEVATNATRLASQ